MFCCFGAGPGQLVGVECQPQLHRRAQHGGPLGSRGLDVDPGVLLVDKVDAFVEGDPSDIETQLPQPALGLPQGSPDHLRDDREAVARLDSDIERHARAGFGLDLTLGPHGTVVAVLLEHVVRGNVGTVDETLDLQPGDLEHVLGLSQRTSGHVGHGNLLLAEGVDRDVDRASGLHLHAPFGQLVEHRASFVCRHEERVVDVQPQVVGAGDALRLAECDAREVGHGAPGAVTRPGLHDEMCDDGHREDDQNDQQQVPHQLVPPEFGQGILQVFHRS